MKFLIQNFASTPEDACLLADIKLALQQTYFRYLVYERSVYHEPNHIPISRTFST
jgi:hypothetical protein